MKENSILPRQDGRSLDVKLPPIKNLDISIIYEYEPQKTIKDDSNILAIFQTTKSSKVKISINPNLTMQELIKFYFKIIKRPDLLGNNGIRFLKNACCIPHDSNELIKNYFKGINDCNIIVVDDVDDIIDNTFIN